MTIEQIDIKLKELSSTCSIDQVKSLVDSLVGLLGISETKNKELLVHRSVDREVTRFVSAPMMRNQAAAYNIPHESNEPIDLKLFWVKNTTKANLSWLVALTPNYEDDPENNENANIGIDFVLSESCDRLYIVLSHKLKLRVLELHETLSHTQREILENWIKISKELDPTSDTYKEQLRSHLWKSFDFEPVNKFFYSKLIEQFDHLVGHLKQTIPEEEAKMFAVKLFGRTLFLWFLRKKEFLNPKIDYFKVSGEDNQTKYYQDFLEPLFFEVLNSEIRGRKYLDDITPFLNGGLFEPTETDFYKDSSLTFPDGFFTQFYALLNKFNFTVDEGTSDYEQVAVDPEMLGRVFENLLASINPETETSARSANGAFYTPRTIVDYMCEQSLIEYLKTKLPESPVRDQRIDELITMNESDFREQDHNKRRDWKRDLGKEVVIKALDELKVLDPAVGSGAFPMGMLQLLVKVYSRIETANENDLASLKRDILSRSLYGVDIDQMAIQISRLRAWLSILVDMQDLRKVEPLPNLDFKFVCANTLIPLAKRTQDNLFDEHELKKELINIRDKYYEATKKIDKKKLREQYLEKIRDGGLFAELESERQRQLKAYNPFDSLNLSSFYDPSLMHGVENFEIVIANPPYVGINMLSKRKDLLIKYLKTNDASLGNYFGVNLHSIPSDRKKYPPKPNLYAFFFVRAHSLISENGLVSFIVPKSLLTAKDLDTVRHFLFTRNTISRITLFKDKVFQHSQTTTGSIATSSLLIFFKKVLAQKDFVTPVSNTVVDSLKSRDHFKIKKNELVKNIKNWNFLTMDETQLSILKKYNSNAGLERYYIHDSKENVSKHKFYFDVGFSLDSSKEKRTLSNEDSRKYYKTFEFKGIKKFILETVGFYPKDKSVIGLTKNSQGYVVLDQKYKLIWSVKNPKAFSFSEEEIIFPMGKAAIIASNDKNELIFLNAILNAKVTWFIIRSLLKHEGEKDMLVPISSIKTYIKIPNVSTSMKINIVEIVLEILKEKNENKNPDTTNLENEIDELVMDLYNFTDEEKEIIRNS